MVSWRVSSSGLARASLLISHHSTVSYQLYRPPLIASPPEEPLPSHVDAPLLCPELWVKYGASDHEPPAPCHFGSSFIAIAEFRVIMNEVARQSFPVARNGVFPGFRLEETLRYYMQLYAWFDNLPEALSARHAILPCHLKIQ